MVLVLFVCILVPYFVFYCFALLGIKNPFYDQRLAQGFGLPAQVATVGQND
jgi:hypothetical protein